MDAAPSSQNDAANGEFAQRVRENQHRLARNLKTHYDFIVWSPFSGSVVAQRLAENPAVSVLLVIISE